MKRNSRVTFLLVLSLHCSVVFGAPDVDLDTTEIRGNRELPNVLYIVPWKQPPVGDFAGKPVESLLDEVLAPLDREVFKRRIDYYEWLKGRERTINSR